MHDAEEFGVADAHTYTLRVMAWLSEHLGIPLVYRNGMVYLAASVPPGEYRFTLDGTDVRAVFDPDQSVHLYCGIYVEISYIGDAFCAAMNAIPNMRKARYGEITTPI